MEIITLSGTVSENCEVREDKKGNPFVTFRVYCSHTGRDGTVKYSYYRCYTYNMLFSDLKQGDLVFLSGDLEINFNIDKNGKVWLNNDVFVKQITKGIVQ